MKFFWKLYLSIMLITVTFFSIGGYFLIQSSFHTSLEREIESVYKENDIYISSLQREFDIPMTDTHDSTLAVKILQNSIGTITIQTLSGNLSFCLRDAQGQIIYQNGGFSDKNN
ncbi:two-component sensor histidine kinase, partial [Coprobacillus cateniformis]|nr:two-component sensor histidine kinase [Coprobacillus cateniformis]